MRLSHCLPSLSLAVLALTLTASLAFAGKTGCDGKNALDEIKAKDAAAYARIRTAADAAKNGKNVLWKIDSEEFPDRPASYLYGTLHLSDERLFAFGPHIEEALSVSQRIATGGEDMSPARLLEAFSVMHETLVEGKAARLETLLARPEAERANVVLARTEMAKDLQPRVRPWVVLALNTQSKCEAERLHQGKLTQDGELERLAENRGVGSFGLETAEMQLGALAAIPDDAQVSLLKANLASHDRIDDQTEALVQLYLAHDLGALWPLQMELAKMHGADPKALDTYRHTVVDVPNARMRDRAMMHLAQGGVFFAVGAVHLSGDKGLVELLRSEGFKITAVE